MGRDREKDKTMVGCVGREFGNVEMIVAGEDGRGNRGKDTIWESNVT